MCDLYLTTFSSHSNLLLWLAYHIHSHPLVRRLARGKSFPPTESIRHFLTCLWHFQPSDVPLRCSSFNEITPEIRFFIHSQSQGSIVKAALKMWVLPSLKESGEATLKNSSQSRRGQLQVVHFKQRSMRKFTIKCNIYLKYYWFKNWVKQWFYRILLSVVPL